MNLALQFHDSEVRRVQAAGDGLSVQFSAASVRSPAERHGAGAGYVLNLDMLLSGATWAGPLADCVGRLTDGSLSVGEEPLSPVPLPLARHGAVTATLTFSNGAVLSVAATAVVLRFSGEPRFVESYAC